MHNKTKGFTVIELLVVIAIIGILMAILLATFNDARMSARDDARQANLKEMQLAIELYKAQNGRYPEAGCGRGTSWTGNTSFGNCSEFIAGLVPDYISQLPVETTNLAGNRGYIYRTSGNGDRYKLMAHLTVETKTISSYEDEFARCPQSFGLDNCSGSGPVANTYAVYSIGAESW